MKRNGIDQELFDGWIADVRREPGSAATTVVTSHRWDDGFAVDNRCESLAEADESYPRDHHRVRTDWPAPFGADSGPTPGAELLCAALGACVTTTYAAKAAQHGVDIAELEVRVTGRVDLRGLLELDGVSAAFAGFDLTLRVHADATGDVLDKLGDITTRTSPVYASLAGRVPLRRTVERMN